MQGAARRPLLLCTWWWGNVGFWGQTGGEQDPRPYALQERCLVTSASESLVASWEQSPEPLSAPHQPEHIGKTPVWSHFLGGTLG